MNTRHTAPTSGVDDRHLRHILRHRECRWLLYGHRQNITKQCPFELALRRYSWKFNKRVNQ